MPRKGYLTPSSFHDLMTNDRTGKQPGKTAYKVMDRLAMDLLGVKSDEDELIPTACQWGLDNEWSAIQTYMERKMIDVDPYIEFRQSPDMEYVGGTCDGLVGDIGGIEVKCPFNSYEHLQNLLFGKQAEEQYKFQIQGYMWIYEREWFDFISYDPRYPEPYDLYIKRIKRDETTINLIKSRCQEAYGRAQTVLSALSKGG